MQLRFARVNGSADRRGRSRFGRATERDVPFARHQAARWVEANPARSGQINLAPGMQVSEIERGAARPVERLHVGRQLDEVTADESRRQTEAAQHLDQQPGRIAARAAQFGQRFLGRLHARFETDEVLDVPAKPLVEGNEKIDGAEYWRGRMMDGGRWIMGRGEWDVSADFSLLPGRAEWELRKRTVVRAPGFNTSGARPRQPCVGERFRMAENVASHRIDQRGQFWRERAGFEERAQVLFQCFIVGERKVTGAFIEEEIKGIVNRHLGDHFHLDREFLHPFLEHQARVPIGERVLLPVDEVLAAANPQRIAQDARAAMRGGPQPHDMRAVTDRLVVRVMRLVIEGYVNCHKG